MGDKETRGENWPSCDERQRGRRGALKGADSFIRQRNLTYCCRMLHEAWYTCSYPSPSVPAWLAAISLTKFAHKSACKVLPACENACGCHSPQPARGRFNNAKMRPQVCSSSRRARERERRGDAKLLHLDAASSLQELRTVSTDRNRQRKPAGELS